MTMDFFKNNNKQMDWLEILNSLENTAFILKNLSLYFEVLEEKERTDKSEFSKVVWEEICQYKSEYPSFKDTIDVVLRSDSINIKNAAHAEIVFIHDKVSSLIKGMPKHITWNANRIEEDSSGDPQLVLRPEGFIQLYLFSIANNCRYYKRRLSMTQPPAPAVLPDKRPRFEIPDNQAGRYAVRKVLEAFLSRRTKLYMTQTELSALIERADFSSIYLNGCNGGVGKANVKYAISFLSHLMGNDWYNEAAQSIGVKKGDCARANASKIVKNLLDKNELCCKIMMKQKSANS